MMTQKEFVEKAHQRLPAGVKDGELLADIAKRLLAEGFVSIVAEAKRSGLLPTSPPVDEHKAIAERAYAISQSPGAGTAAENWARAEAELKAGK